MKILKVNALLSVLFISSFAQADNAQLAKDLESIQAGTGADTNIISENNPSASKRNPDKYQSPWNFELKNMAKDGLIIQLKQGNRDLLLPQNTYVPASRGSKQNEQGYLRLAGIKNISGAFELRIWRLQPGEDKKFFSNPEQIFNTTFKSGRKPNKTYTIKANPKRKTILLTYEKDELRPQKGDRLKGMTTGYGSSSGLSMFGNIEKSDIK